MKTALFINGIHESVLEEIIKAQSLHGNIVTYLQPYRAVSIKPFKKQAPSIEKPVRLYASTTSNLNNICYTAEIVNWEDKRVLSDQRRIEIVKHLERFQPKELLLFQGKEEKGKAAVNLLAIQNLKPLVLDRSTSLLFKTSDGLPHKKRTQSGNWSVVFDLGDLVTLPSETLEQNNSILADELKS